MISGALWFSSLSSSHLKHRVSELLNGREKKKKHIFRSSRSLLLRECVIMRWSLVGEIVGGTNYRLRWQKWATAATQLQPRPRSCETASSARCDIRTSHISWLLSRYLLIYWSCYDSRCSMGRCSNNKHHLLLTTPVLRGPPVTGFPCVCRSPLFTNRRADQENQSALCFHLRRKPERSRMPSSREPHSCLAMCRESGDKWHSL